MPTKLPEEICVALNILKSLNQAVGTVKHHREEGTGDGEMEMMEGSHVCALQRGNW